MGVCVSTQQGGPGDTQQKARAKGIEDRMMAQIENERKVIKCLLLGAGECGKSTILKQMKILHKNGFTDQEKQQAKELAYRNTMESVQTLLRACLDLSIKYDSPEVQKQSVKLLEVDRNDGTLQYDLKDDVKELWKDGGTQKAFARANEFHLLDSAAYFLHDDQLDRVFSEEYKPTHQDILRCRLATTGIIQNEFLIEKLKFKMYDVGGQRGERKKWIHSFDNVNAIMFIGSLAEYDLVLAEDRTRNRLKESLDLFEGIINLPWFKEAPIILFLNKNDLFIEKIKTVDIGIYFPVYVGGCDYEAGLKFIQDNYFDRNQSPHKTIYCHVTDATNTEVFAFVWKSTKHMILEQNLTKSGLLMC